MAFDPSTAVPFDPSSAAPVNVPPAAPPGIDWSYQGDRFKKGAAGLMSLAGAPVSALATLAEYSAPAIISRAMGGPEMRFEDPVGGMGQVRRGYEGLFGVQDLKPPSEQNRYLGGVSEFAGGGIMPAAAVVSRAAQPVLAALTEAGGILAGGVGHEAGGPVGGIIGSLMGTNIPTLVSKVKGAIPQVFKAGKEAVAADRMAGKEITGAIRAHPEAEANVAKANEIIDRMKGAGAEFNPTLGTVTNAPGVLSMERKFAQDSGEDLSRYTGRMGEMDTAISQAKNNLFPQGSRSVQRMADERVMQANRAVEAKLDALTEQLNRLAESIPSATQQSAGEQLRRLRDAAQTEAKGVKNAKIKDLYTEAERTKTGAKMDDVADFVSELEKADPNAFQNMPPVFAKVKKQYGRPDQAELTGRSIPPDLMADASKGATEAKSFEEIHSLWRQANREYGDAMRAGDSQKAMYLAKLKDKLKEKVDSFENSAVGDKLKDFNKFYAEKYAPAFKEGVGGRMAGQGKYGEILKPEDVVGKFFSPSGVDDFRKIYGGGDEASATLRDGVLGLFKKEAVRNGVVNQRAAANFQRTHAETLDKLPDVKKALADTTKINDELSASASRLRDRQRLVDKSRVAELAKNEDVDGLIEKAFTNPKELRTLVALGSDKAGKDAVARALADRIGPAAEKAGKDPLALLMENQDVMRPALNRLGPKHFENLETLAGAMSIRARANPVPSTANVSGKPQDVVEKVTGSTPRTIWSQTANTAAGRQSSVSMVLHLLSRFGIKARGEDASRLMHEAIYKPELAADLAKAVDRPIGGFTDLGNRFRDHLLSAGIRIAGSETDKEE